MAEFGFSIFLLLTCTCVNLYVSSASVPEDETISKSINEFGATLINGLFADTPAKDNILVSPVNAYAALALLHLGAGEKTLKELGPVMKIPEKYATRYNVHENLQALFSNIAAPNEGPSMRQFYDTTLANGIFVQNNFPIKDSFKSLASKYYNNTEAQNVDFVNKAPESTEIINKWISKSTKGRITKFYESPLESDTIAVLTSALYFIGKWKKSFPEKFTQKEKFRTGEGEIETPMMNLTSDLMYETNNNLHYDSVTLPYAGRDYEMTIYLQHEHHGDHGSLAHLYHELAQKNFMPEKLEHVMVEVKLPKMKFSWKQSLVHALKLEKIFAEADLSAMTSQPVRVSKMTHATDLEVDEKGTVATAATGIEMVLYSLPQLPSNVPIKFHVNRPFLTTIKHKDTNTVLFAGIIRKPM